MTIDAVRTICRAFPGVTEDIKWGSDLVFSVGGKMYTVICLDPPHTVAFKCTTEMFAELVEREGIIPAPYLARASWVQAQGLADSLDRRELEQLVRASHELVSAKLPKPRLKKKEQTPAARPRRRVRAKREATSTRRRR